MRLNISKSDLLINFLFLALLTFITICFYYNNFSTAISYSILILFSYTIYKILRSGLSSNITIIAFLVTFFTFLLTRIFLSLFTNIDNLIVEIGGGRTFNNTIQSFVNLALYISLLSIYVGYCVIYYTRKSTKAKNGKLFYENRQIIRVRKFSKLATIIFSFFAAINIFDQIRYVMNHGYIDFYLNYSNSIPYVIVFLAAFFDYFFIFYMATMPPKKECLPIVIIYLIINISSMGMGQRGSAVLAVMFVISYFFIRNKINSGGKLWITKKGIIAITLSIPIIISILFLMAYSRSDEDTGKFANQNLIVNFFYQQGVTVNVIGFAKDYKNKLPEGKFYSVGKIIEFLNHNIISQKLLGTAPIQPQTREHALKDHTLHATLTYMESPNLYLSGGGYGGCYIADLWVDWGIIGIIIGNFIYGICLAKIPEWCSKSFWKASMGLLMYTCILFAPRSNYIDYVYVFIPFAAIICFSIVFMVKNTLLINQSQTNIL